MLGIVGRVVVRRVLLLASLAFAALAAGSALADATPGDNTTPVVDPKAAFTMPPLGPFGPWARCQRGLPSAACGPTRPLDAAKDS